LFMFPLSEFCPPRTTPSARGFLPLLKIFHVAPVTLRLDLQGRPVFIFEFSFGSRARRFSPKLPFPATPLFPRSGEEVSFRPTLPHDCLVPRAVLSHQTFFPFIFFFLTQHGSFFGPFRWAIFYFCLLHCAASLQEFSFFAGWAVPPLFRRGRA